MNLSLLHVTMISACFARTSFPASSRGFPGLSSSWVLSSSVRRPSTVSLRASTWPDHPHTPLQPHVTRKVWRRQPPLISTASAALAEGRTDEGGVSRCTVEWTTSLHIHATRRSPHARSQRLVQTHQDVQVHRSPLHLTCRRTAPPQRKHHPLAHTPTGASPGTCEWGR